ncbi:MAG: YlbF family regulator [Clostridia bacterium]|jgi:cell fate (sporulation/competence/biofilm development) regulator YlbF (YheA/YmcA/DUF963 family)|nr:YlbF family regulator [Clostridia bacterium]
MNVYDQAHQLALAIKESDEFKRYDAGKKQISSNENLKEMLNDFQKRSMELQLRQLQGEQPDPEDMASVQRLLGVITMDPLASQYLEAEMRFSLMMKDVYDILQEAAGMGEL